MLPPQVPCDELGQYCPESRLDATKSGTCGLVNDYNPNAIEGSYCPDSSTEIPCVPPNEEYGAHCGIGLCRREAAGHLSCLCAGVGETLGWRRAMMEYRCTLNTIECDVSDLTDHP